MQGMFPGTRLRRNRMKEFSRRLIAENNLSVNDLILPLFVCEGNNVDDPINSMPGVSRNSIDILLSRVEKAVKLNIPAVAIFPQIENNLKNSDGSLAIDENNLVCRSIKSIKKNFPNIGIICDVALDPFTDHGHDGLVINDKIDNDKTLVVLEQQALIQANAGCDVIAPSDMMDGRIGKIRKALDNSSYKDVQILSYAAKYASSFYGPFRNAIGSKKSLKGDKKTYQMDFRNSDEALREIALDIKEGADMVMVKPGMPYLDIIKSIKEKFRIPVFAYQVSGEYSLISNAIQKKLIDESAIFESLIAFKRSGANAIVSYYADRIDKIIR